MSEASTLLDALGDALRHAAEYNKDDQAPPAAILWTDKEGQWQPLLPDLRQRLFLVTFGPYAPGERKGPAHYIRCLIGRTLPDDLIPAEVTPIVYLPGVSRQDLRAIEECPRDLQPLAGLQYSGVLWTHKNGRDWTIAGFLQSADCGLGIPVAADNATREALLRALPVLAGQPLSYLRKEAPLRAPFLDALPNPDEVRRLLLWMNDPASYQAAAGAAEWTAFCKLVQHKYGFHPQADGELAAGQRLGQPKGGWEAVWQRFLEAPDAYPHIPALLRRAGPAVRQLALFEPSPYWPQDNEAAEGTLRQGLLHIKDKLPGEARALLYALEAEHSPRRNWVWAKIDQAPLAGALEHLVRLAKATEIALAGASVPALAESYAGSGWQADAAALDALAAVETVEDVAAIKAALLPLYRPWLEKAALAFQGAVLSDPARNYLSRPLPAVSAGTCIVFSDALRMDAGQRLAGMLAGRGYSCKIQWGLAALPPVTPTAKPAVAPIADKLAGGSPGLMPQVKASGSLLTAVSFRKLLADAGYQVLSEDETGQPAGNPVGESTARAWTESGAIDQYGHGHGWKIARHVRGELRALEERIAGLLEAGWQRVLVVTDHGWLMLPGGLPKVELPQALTVERKGRCAVLKEGAHTDQPSVPWRWNPQVCIAVAPGIGCYEAGVEYDHGGLSPQECVVPVIEVTVAGGAALPAVSLAEVTWKGLRCHVKLAGDSSAVHVDIRTKAADPATSIIDKPKQPAPDGSLSLPVPDDDRAGEAAFVVVLSQSGALCAQRLTTVGG